MVDRRIREQRPQPASTLRIAHREPVSATSSESMMGLPARAGVPHQLKFELSMFFVPRRGLNRHGPLASQLTIEKPNVGRV
jgi:hypothetical protein